MKSTIRTFAWLAFYLTLAGLAVVILMTMLVWVATKMTPRVNAAIPEQYETIQVTAKVPYNGSNMPVINNNGGNQLETYNPQQAGLNN